MNVHFRKIGTLTLLIVVQFGLFGQILAKGDRLNKWNEEFEAGLLKVCPVAAPIHTPEIGLGLGVGILGSFKTKRNNNYLSHSDFSFLTNTDLQAQIQTKLKLNTFWYDDVLKLEMEVEHKNYGDNYYGIAHDLARDSIYEQINNSYTKKEIQVKVRPTIRVAKTAYLGISTYYTVFNASGLSPFVREDILILKQGTEIKTVGAGLNFNYNSRSKSGKGNVRSTKFEFVAFNKSLKSDFSFLRLTLDYTHEFIVFSKDRLFINLYTENNYGKVPWSEMATLGGSNGLMGIAQGKFRNNSATGALLDYWLKLGPVNIKTKSKHNISFQFGSGTVYGADNTNPTTIINMAVGYLIRCQPNKLVSLYAAFAGNSGGLYLTHKSAF